MSEGKITRLASAAKELNVGISTIVDHLHSKGFKDVASTPNTKLTEEQYDILLRDFRSDIVAKEKAEHYTIVDLIRNDLSMVSDKVRVTKFRYIDRLKTNFGEILQVSSEVEGTLRDGYTAHLGDIIFTLLPAGSISGAPKERTVQIIRSAETYDRGFYTGIAGIFDGENLDSTVLIRFIEEQDGRKYFKSGGGITFMSDARAEYEEMISKVYVPFS